MKVSAQPEPVRLEAEAYSRILSPRQRLLFIETPRVNGNTNYVLCVIAKTFNKQTSAMGISTHVFFVNCEPTEIMYQYAIQTYTFHRRMVYV